MEIARQMALNLPDTTEYDHFGKPAFKAKKTFATLWLAGKRIMVKLSLVDQSVFHSFDPAIFYPVPNKWGLKGATFIELDLVREDMLLDALTCAYELSTK